MTAKRYLNKAEREQRIGDLVRCSSLTVYLSKLPLMLHLAIGGDLAAIPSLKNSKNPFGGMDHGVECRIKALDLLFQQVTRGELQNRFPLFEPGERVWLLLSNAQRSRKYDLIGPLETVQDWLEPGTKVIGQKKKRYRGWGIGALLDDCEIVPTVIENTSEITHIVLRPFTVIADHLNNFVSVAQENF